MRLCCSSLLAGKPVRVLACRYIRTIDRSTLSFARSSKNTNPISCPIWRHRAGYCRSMPSASSRTTSDAAVSNTVSCECTAIAAMPNTWLHSVAPTVGALGKRREFCPSCGARRMAESATLLVDAVLPEQPVRQWVLSFPLPWTLRKKAFIL